MALMEWLGDSARVALQKSHSSAAENSDRFHSSHQPGAVLPMPAVAHVHTVAAILWHNHDQTASGVNMKQVLTRELLRLF